MIRLNKFIAGAGVTSRRKADELVFAGKVKVNGQIVDSPGIKVDEVNDIVEIDCKKVEPASGYVYYALYKPKGVVSTASDELGRQTVVDLVPKEPRVYPVGRLDADSEGLMILTNDGGLAQKLTHPSFKHEKEYLLEARIRDRESWKNKDPEKIIPQKFKTGLSIDDKLMKADRVEATLIRNLPVRQAGSLLQILIVLHTGYNRQIRKMCDKIGLDVIKLIRTREGNLTIKSLDINPGEHASITKDQII